MHGGSSEAGVRNKAMEVMSNMQEAYANVPTMAKEKTVSKGSQASTYQY